MKNRFNRLTSKEWLPFQKSWFKYESDEKLLTENIRFFCRAEPGDEIVYYYGHQSELVQKICSDHDVQFAHYEQFKGESVQFACIDLRDEISSTTNLDEYLSLREKTLDLCKIIFESLVHRRFLCILVPNVQNGPQYLPFAWDLGLQLGSLFSLKDEKIACTPDQNTASTETIFTPSNKHFYCLYFRKDENSAGVLQERKHHFFENNIQTSSGIKFKGQIPSWFILKPAPRKKDEILHPAKYPEDLVTMFVNEFTIPNANVLDPMSGTGSTQVAALKAGRNAFGTELSDFFAEIASQRCSNIVQPIQKELFLTENHQRFILLNKDARSISKDDFPDIDYLITSPPYWDMLNMKGAENQAKRIEKGLQTNYSESTEDLGNISDYESFLADLTDVYFNILQNMKSSSYITIVVKNIKKKGRNYPFAWDLADRLLEKVILLPEVFWCQDDINLAPYGYGNTFVSNTFHQYCLNFQVK